MKISVRGFVAALRVLALSFALVSVAPVPAHASGIPVVDLAASTLQTAKWLWERAQQYMSEYSASARGVVGAIGSYINAKINLINLDTASANERTTAEAAQGMAVAVDYGTTKYYKPCDRAGSGKSQAAMASLERASRAAAASAGFKPDDLNTQAKDILARTQLGLVPCSESSMEASVHQAYKCKENRPPWADEFDFQRQDMSMETAIFKYDQFPWPPKYRLSASGEYGGIPDRNVITSAKYMPLAAALSYCQRIRARFSIPVQSLGDKATAAGLSIDGHEDAQAAASTAYNTCMSLVMERVMYGTFDSSAPKEYRMYHAAQARSCENDIENGILDGDNTDDAGSPHYTFADGTSGTCKRDGRSSLQSMKDYWFRIQSKSFHAKSLAGYTNDMTGLLTEGAEADARTKYREHINSERATLAAAIAQAQAVVMPTSSGLGTMTKQ